MKKIFFFPMIAFLSCNYAEKKDTPSSSEGMETQKEEIQKQSVNDFIPMVKGINISNINTFIHPEKGVWLIQSSGAMPNMTNTTQVDKNFPVDFSGAKEDSLPQINCDTKNLWTKEGVFAQKINLFAGAHIWKYCNLPETIQEKISKITQTISWTVINTSLNARYYFSLIKGKWYLTFVDLRRPCEA